MIKEVCNKLKEKRQELGYSIEYTVEKTKLHPSVIKDIEEGNLKNIGPTYIKGFMKIYASFLGVDLGACLDEINLTKPTINKQKKVKSKDSLGSGFVDAMIIKVKKIPPEAKKKIFIVLIGIVFLWVFFTVGRLTIRKISKSFKDKGETVENIQPESFTASQDAKEVVVSLTAKKKCFLRVRVDGKLLFEGALAQGAIETWRGDKEIEFKISDGSAVYLEVNGKSVPTLSSIRKPIKSLKITPSGISVDK